MFEIVLANNQNTVRVSGMNSNIQIEAYPGVVWTYSNRNEVRDAIEWLEEDAAYLDRHGVKDNAANSRRLAEMLKAKIAA